LIHVAIVSHGHENLLISSALGGLLGAGNGLKVWLKDNKPSATLKEYCAAHAIFYTDEHPGLGFGHNNNFLYDLIRSSDGFSDDDFFIVMNPDVTIAPDTIFQLIEKMRSDQCALATLNLYRDQEFVESDANIRRFPDMLSLARMTVVRSVSEPYNKNDMSEPCYVDWASGAFLAFNAKHYSLLQGFDLRYFMYFEDVDICYRSQILLHHGVRYYPNFKATHAAAHKNRNLASKHAIWFFQSFMKFLSRRYFNVGTGGLTANVK
jgi:N-acetylglucosaminyl-diphospho-decaprenol L-rhamnosyltransferase